MRLLQGLTALFALCCLARIASGEELLISAAASLTDALNEIGTSYEHETAGVKITHNFGGSGTLQKQIENGAPADIFISAAAEPMDALEKQGLLHAGSRADLLVNTLVLITPKDRKDVQGFADLTKPQVKHLAIGEPKSVPAGAYAMECFATQKLTPRLAPKFIRLLNVRQVLAAVATGNADAGMVYRTDATSSDKVRIAAEAPHGSHRPIVYPVAIMRRSRHVDAAVKYIAFLKSKKARAIFEKHGFTVSE